MLWPLGVSSQTRLNLKLQSVKTAKNNITQIGTILKSGNYHTGQSIADSRISEFISLLYSEDMEVSFEGDRWPESWSGEPDATAFIYDLLDLKENGDKYPEIFRWNCCGESGDEAGCKMGKHGFSSGNPLRIIGSKRDHQSLATLWVSCNTDARTCNGNLYREFYHW